MHNVLRKIAWSVGFESFVMNWGRNAAKNMVVFGFRRAMAKPSRRTLFAGIRRGFSF
jgi:hypothetical protein